MPFRLTSEDELLDIDKRKKIIEEICGPENRARKDEAFKRYQCYKDQTHLYVLKQLLRQFDSTTVFEMSYAISNLGITRKVVDKLARVYKYGVNRKADTDELTQAIQDIVKECDIDQAFKKTNRFLKLEKNCVQYVIPKPYAMNSDLKTIKTMVLPPYLYDAVELDDNREKPACYILSDYHPRNQGINSGAAASVVAQSSPTPEKHGPGIVQFPVYGDGIDQTIADRPEDQNAFGGFIFWSDSYHFTCDEKGVIISQGPIDNPIKQMPFVNYAEDQDGAFWAIGGNDLVDGAILVNSMITNINHIAITQGYGQLVMSGKNLPRSQKVGPNKAVLLEQLEGDPTPTFEFKTANPPLDELRSIVEMYVALLLTTNNLTTTGVSSNLSNRQTFPSGIALMIDKSESMEDIEDQRQIFLDNEPRFWDIFASWHRVLKSQNLLCEELSTVDLPEDMELSIEWEEPTVIETELDRLNALQLKINMGLVSKLDALRSEYPTLDDDALKAKLEEIMQEKAKALADAQANMGAMNGSNGPQSNQGQNGFGNQPGSNGRDQGQSGGVSGGANPNEGASKAKPGNG